MSHDCRHVGWEVPQTVVPPTGSAMHSCSHRRPSQHAMEHYPSSHHGHHHHRGFPPAISGSHPDLSGAQSYHMTRAEFWDPAHPAHPGGSDRPDRIRNHCRFSSR